MSTFKVLEHAYASTFVILRNLTVCQLSMLPLQGPCKVQCGVAQEQHRSSCFTCKLPDDCGTHRDASKWCEAPTVCKIEGHVTSTVLLQHVHLVKLGLGTCNPALVHKSFVCFVAQQFCVSLQCLGAWLMLKSTSYDPSQVTHQW